MSRRLLLAFMVCIATGAARAREWTDRSGSSRIEAEFQVSKGSTAVLAKADGTTLKVPLEKLSDYDRRFVEVYQSASVIEFRRPAGFRRRGPSSGDRGPRDLAI